MLIRIKQLLPTVILLFTIPMFGQVFDPAKGCVIDNNGECISNTLLTAVPFLRITPDARSGAMGDAGVALSPNANSLHFNASNLVFSEEQ